MMKKSINVYDFDHTIYDGDASVDFILYCMLRHPRTWKYFPSQGIAIMKYLLDDMSRKEIKQVAFAFLRDIPDVENLVRRFWDSHEHKIKPWYLAQKQTTDLIISASPEFLLKPIAEKLGIATPIATVMDPQTGKINGENCRAKEKVTRFKAAYPSAHITACYSDSLSDTPLLELADNAYIVKKHTITELQVHLNDKMGRVTIKETMLQNKALLRELFLYGIIGGSTAALDIVLFKAFRTAGIQLLIANFMSVSISLAASFILNAKYNFKKTDNLHKRATKFFAIGYFGWLVQSIILWVGVDHWGIRELFVKIFAVFIAAAIQYVLNKFLTFRD